MEVKLVTYRRAVLMSGDATIISRPLRQTGDHTLDTDAILNHLYTELLQEPEDNVVPIQKDVEGIIRKVCEHNLPIDYMAILDDVVIVIEDMLENASYLPIVTEIRKIIDRNTK